MRAFRKYLDTFLRRCTTIRLFFHPLRFFNTNSSKTFDWSFTNTLFIALQDADERCYSDSLAELPEYCDPAIELASGGNRVRALNLDIIKRRLDKGLYKRLDLFQRDIFSVLERARKLSRTDSQIFEDSVELQSFFIKTRDEACEHGEILQSRALLYTQSDLMRAVEELRAQKQLSEQPEEDGGATEGQNEGGDATNTATFNMQQVSYKSRATELMKNLLISCPFSEILESVFH